jgi:hypothetical protein
MRHIKIRVALGIEIRAPVYAMTQRRRLVSLRKTD